MSLWREPKRRSELREALVDVAEAPLVNVFRHPGGEDQKKFPILAEAAHELEPFWWAKGHYNTALTEMIRRAIQSLPRDKGPERPGEDFEMSWQEIAATLFGFENIDKASKVGTRKAYSRYRQVVADALAPTSEGTFKRRVADAFSLLADGLASLNVQAEELSLPTISATATAISDQQDTDTTKTSIAAAEPTLAVAGADNPPSSETWQQEPEHRPSNGFGSKRTRLAVYSGIALLVMAIGLASFITLKSSLGTTDTNTLIEACGHSGAPLTARIVEVDFPPIRWITAGKLPDSLLEQLNAPGGNVDIDQLLAPYDLIVEGADGRHRLILIGQCKRPVVVTAIRSKIVSQSAPLTGGYLFLPTQGDVDVKSAALNLDPPGGAEALEYDANAGQVKGPFFDRKIASVADGETYPVDLYGQTKRYTVEWKVVIDTVIGDKEISIEADLPRGKPLRSTAIVEQYESSFIFNHEPFAWENLKGRTH
ncbi:hypothetical protein [Allorhizocola rhizosphaerae]|uniref:hypothetical protein n=1 Tax=Allorhizocola rhizosphaerae TaxID=1872709 RepID=UPI0013C2F035|nr:hypothetical protein [Allorhizocola rhizosphaerae]